MQLSLKWLSEFVELADINPQELAHRITMSGLEVSNIEDQRNNYNQVIIGKILSIEPHPNADKLQLTVVEVPNQKLSIVCGAKNIAVNDIVPVAMVGANLPGGLEIRKSKIRGEESQGMLCSEKELALAEDADGIMHFPSDTPIGTDIATLIGKDDVIIEVEVTPNRSDCLSHYGVARHLAAILNRPLHYPSSHLFDNQPSSKQDYQIKLEKNAGCRRYCCRFIENITIAPSPTWLKHRLESLGIRSINNVVDATNYILIGYGHPLHAFDLDLLEGKTISARSSQSHEKITTIDGQVHQLTGQELIIADGQKPVALAGVMGGLDTEVKHNTKNILLEAAWFDAKKVRQTSKITNCASDSAYRFERGVDPEKGLILALNSCAELIVRLAGGNLVPGIIDNYADPYNAKSICFDFKKAEKLLGMELNEQELIKALERQAYSLNRVDQHFEIIVPSHRHDVHIEQDIIEDIAQIIGYDNIPVKNPMLPLMTPTNDITQAFLLKCRTLVKESGYSEILSYSFINPKHFDLLRLPEDHPWRTSLVLRNPLSETLSHMRTSLLPGLLDTLVYNNRRGQERIQIFETGSVFYPTKQDQLPEEPLHLGLISMGNQTPLYWQDGKQVNNQNFYDIKGVLDNLLQKLRIKSVTLDAVAHPFLHPLVSYNIISSDKKNIGWIGALHPEIQDHYKLKQLVYVAEIDLSLLVSRWQPLPKIKKHSRYPAIKRDLAIAVPQDILAGDVMKKISRLGTELLETVVPFDQYNGDTLATGTKSLAFSLTFQHNDRTLKEDEVNQIQASIIKQLQKQFSATQR